MTRQYLAVKFRPSDAKSYTYHHDGEPVKVGDQVKAPDKSGEGWNRVTVSAIVDKPMGFDTKPILGLAPSVDDEIIARANDQADGLPYKPDLFSGIGDR